MMVKQDDADGMVAGAINASADVLRAALQTLKTAPGTRIVSAFFLVVVPDCQYGANGTFVFADAEPVSVRACRYCRAVSEVI